jgi:hypothetical protein
LDLQHRFLPLLRRTVQFPGQLQVAEFKDVDGLYNWRDFANGEELDKTLSADFDGPRSEASFVDLERAYSRLECRTRNPQPRRRPGGSEHPSVARAQRFLDDPLLMST